MTKNEAREVLGQEIAIQKLTTVLPDDTVQVDYYVGKLERGHGSRWMRVWGWGASLHDAVQRAKTRIDH